MRIGVIGDPHEPVSRAGYLDFCTDTFEHYHCDVIVCIGDLIDWHGISFHARQPECPGVKDEYHLALERVQKWYSRFPNLHWCIGNHDERPARLAQTVNIAEFMLKPYNEIWSVPGWTYEYEYKFDGAVYLHGTGTSGIHPAWNKMNKRRESIVMGHCHSRAGAKWGANRNKRFFAVDTGCGVDDRTFQFAYGKHLDERSMLACAVIDDGQPISIGMKCGRGEKYHDSRFVTDADKKLVHISKFGNKKMLKQPTQVHFLTDKDGKEVTACGTEGTISVTSKPAAVLCGNCERTVAFKKARGDI
jgi:predicted phosphodiesterase